MNTLQQSKSKLGFTFLAIICLLNPAQPARLVADELFPDKALEAVVRKEVFAKRYNDEPLTKEDVEKISQVEGKDAGIKSLQGLEHCLRVQLIDLEDNEIENLAPLAELKMLQSVNLAGNKIKDIDPLKKLDRMQYLQLERNQIESIEAVAGMTNMRSLYLSGNKIKDIAQVKPLTKVWSLYLAGNPVKDFTPVGQLKWLANFDASDCGLKQIEFLRPVPRLEYLQLSNNKLDDLSVLVEMAESDEERRFAPFWRIYLKDNPLDGESAQKQLQRLRELGARIVVD